MARRPYFQDEPGHCLNPKCNKRLPTLGSMSAYCSWKCEKEDADQLEKKWQQVREQ